MASSGNDGRPDSGRRAAAAELSDSMLSGWLFEPLTRAAVHRGGSVAPVQLASLRSSQCAGRSRR